MNPEAISVGTVVQYSRRFTREDILAFCEVSQDRGNHHTEGEKLLAHGLLVATLPTKIGGDLNYLAQTMNFKFIQAVYEGESIECRGRVTRITDQDKRIKLEMEFSCFNEKGEVVMSGDTRGMIWKKNN